MGSKPEELWKIPNNWQWARVDELGAVVSGGTPSTRNPSYWGGSVSWISPADLTGYTAKYIASGAKSITEEGLANSSARLMPKGTVLFSSRAPVGYVAIAESELATNQGFKSLVPAEGMESEFLYYYFKASKSLAEAKASGTTFKELSGKVFAGLPVVVPPRDEQRRIVAKIEELFSELDNGVESLKTARAQLQTYRQSLLKAAFEGRLTEQWRRDNADKLETANQLVQRISEEREICQQQQLDEWKAAVAKWEMDSRSGPKPRKPRAHKAVSMDLDASLRRVDSWVWKPLAEISGLIVDGTHKTPNYVDRGVPFISAKDIGDFTIDFSESRFITKEEHSELINRCRPSRHDVLITKSGTIGRVAVVETDQPFSVFESVAVVPVSKCMSSRFIAYACYFYINNGFGEKTQKGVAVRHLHLEDLRRLPVPVPPFEEQKRLVGIIEQHLSFVRSMEADIEAELGRAEHLRQSILKRAFEGKLIPQDPNDEPASALLERIRQDQAAKPAPANNRRRKQEVTAELFDDQP